MVNCQFLIKKVTSNRTKHLLDENELKKLKTFDSIYFRGKNFEKEEGVQNCLVFQPIQRYFKIIFYVGNDNYVYYWKSKESFDEKLNSIKTSDNRITPYWSYYNFNKTRVKFDGGCLKQDQATILHGLIVNVYIVYEICININISDYPTLESCLFGAVKLTKNADIDEYGYSGYGIGFDRHGSVLFPGTGLGTNVIIFGVDMSSSREIDKIKKDILILGKGPTQGFEKMCLTNFTENNKIFYLSMHYDKENSYLFVNGTEIIKFKSKDPEILAHPLCLGNISKDRSADYMKNWD